MSETCDVRNNLSIAERIQRCLSEIDAKIVFAESCTGGEIASTLARLPGISKHLCGSFVTYRADSKRLWIGVKQKTIKRFTTESIEVAKQMAVGSLSFTPEATWSLAVVGHFGPDAPEELDGKIFVSIARRTRKGNLKISVTTEHIIKDISDRVSRQKIATEVCLTILARELMKRTSANTSKVSNG